MQRGKECIPAATDTPQMRSCFGSVRVEAGYIVTGKIPEHHKCSAQCLVVQRWVVHCLVTVPTVSDIISSLLAHGKCSSRVS
jgi:hypothetical protein